MKTLDLSKIHLVDFPHDQYSRQATDKNQIVLHHTVSGPGSKGDINWWKQSKARIATHLIIERTGRIVQCFSSRFWAHHLGIKNKVFDARGIEPRNRVLNMHSIAIEFDSWGGILQEQALSFSHPIVEYTSKYRGFKYFEQYTDAQIESARQLIVYLANVYNIDLSYKADMWDLSYRALKGDSGVWTHTSFRPDKSDCHPQPELVQMLKNLNNA